MEIEKGEDGLWWVVKEGVRTTSFTTRTEARLYLGLPTTLRYVNPGDLDEAYFDRLSPIEARIASLRLRGASQSEIAIQVNVTQPTVAYHLRKAIWRTRILKKCPGLDLKSLTGPLQEIVGVKDAELFLDFVALASQSKVSRKHGRTQGFVRHRIKRVIQILEGHEKFAQLLEAARLRFRHPGAFRVSTEPNEEFGDTQLAVRTPSRPLTE